MSPICQKLSVAQALDALGRHAHHVVPDLLGLVVGVVHRDPDAVGVEAEHLGDELPRPRDGVGLEVVAEAEVAEHLEERRDAAFVRPTSSRSLCLPPARTHFCTDVTARWYGAVSSPTKYGLNGTMPATVNSTVGSCGMRLADGTIVWARSAKKPAKACAIVCG